MIKHRKHLRTARIAAEAAAFWKQTGRKRLRREFRKMQNQPARFWLYENRHPFTRKETPTQWHQKRQTHSVITTAPRQ